ncbi:MAG: hypothetical protein Q9188_000175, partial [Gyalolechia gomerana]
LDLECIFTRVRAQGWQRPPRVQEPGGHLQHRLQKSETLLLNPSLMILDLECQLTNRSKIDGEKQSRIEADPRRAMLAE